MNTEDKLYTKIKNASKKGETPDFPGMENVWNRVENKLDAHVLKKENTKWKQYTVAASIVVVGTILYTFWFSNDKNTLETIKNEEIITEIKEVIPTNQNEVIVATDSFESSPLLKPNADEILESAIVNSNTVVMEEKIEKLNIKPQLSETTLSPAEIKADKIKANADKFASMKKESVVMSSKGVRNVQYDDAETTEEVQHKKLPPLVVVNGEASDMETLKELNAKELDSVVTLVNPIYIINGKQFTEQELFGPNPTSEYAPLTEQNITSTTILEEEEAIQKFGAKGKQGVIIITTKNGKPKN